MANFVVNSTSKIAVRKSEVIGYHIEPYERELEEVTEAGFNLLLKMSRGYDPDVIFEQAETMEALQPLVTAFHTAMES